MTFSEKLKQYIERTDYALNNYLKEETIPEYLQSSMSYSLFAGGKRLRPCILLATNELLGGFNDNAMPFACALEMIHTYSLIHDDLPSMDNDILRRGKPTNHIVFGEGQAILAGDGLLSYAFEIMLRFLLSKSEPNFIKAAYTIARAAGVTGMVAGQCLDLLTEGQKTADEALLIKIHKTKTSAMIQAASTAGALCANSAEGIVKAMCAFGAQLGLLFQITDDILDVIGETSTLGKTTGKDERAGKLTFPSIYGINGALLYAKKAADAALCELQPFGKDAWFLQELVESIMNRKS